MTLQQLCNVTYNFFVEGKTDEERVKFDREISGELDRELLEARMRQGAEPVREEPPPESVGLMAAFHMPVKE